MFFQDKFSFFKDKIYRRLTLITVFVLANGTIFYHFIEKLSWLDALYFSVITLTTVGYGDISPQTDLGKAFTIVYIISGIGIIFGFINALSQHRIERANRRLKKIRKEK